MNYVPETIASTPQMPLHKQLNISKKIIHIIMMKCFPCLQFISLCSSWFICLLKFGTKFISRVEEFKTSTNLEQTNMKSLPFWSESIFLFQIEVEGTEFKSRLLQWLFAVTVQMKNCK